MRLILDGDDTIWLEEQQFKELKALLLGLAREKRLDVGLVEEDLESAIGRLGFGRTVFVQALQETATRHDLGEELRNAAGSRIEDLLRFSMQLVDGFAEFAAKSLESDLRLYLYTKGRQEEQMRKVRALELETLFTQIFVVPTKGPEMLQTVLQNIGGPAINADRGLHDERLIVIGNCPRDDISPAVALGVEAIYFNPPGNPRSKRSLPVTGYSEACSWHAVQRLIF